MWDLYGGLRIFNRYSSERSSYFTILPMVIALVFAKFHCGNLLQAVYIIILLWVNVVQHKITVRMLLFNSYKLEQSRHVHTKYVKRNLFVSW